VFVAMAALIIGLGYFGAHRPTTAAVTRTAAASSPQSAVAANQPIANTVASEQPATSGPDGLRALTGLAQRPLPSNGITATSSLPVRIVDPSMALVGSRLFYIIANYRIESSVIGSSAEPQTLAIAADGESINGLAAASDWLIYAATSAGGAAAQPDGSGSALKVNWSVWLVDLRSGVRRQLAAGTRYTSEFSDPELPVHVAMSDSAYAFDRPASTAGAAGSETVEVHSIDGGLMWSSQSPATVLSLMLGGSRLAILTQDTATRTGPRTLWLSDATHPAPVEVSHPASSASLSSDGAYLAWDLQLVSGLSQQSLLSDVGVEATASGVVTFLRPPTTASALAAFGPSVSSTAGGPVVAWLATSPGGLVYPAFSFAGGGSAGFFDAGQQPVWLRVDGTRLTWVTERHDGGFATAVAIDLAGS
jgi:hypothetical protein